MFKELSYGDTFDNDKLFNNFFYLRVLFSEEKEKECEDLQIKEVKYASPGFSDFAGFGKIIENMIDLIKHYIPNKNQKLENEKLELDNFEKKIRMLNSIGYSPKEIRKFLDIRNHTISNLKQLKDLNKVISFELRKNVED